MQPGAERIASRFHLDPAPWFRAADPQPSLQTVARAVWSAQILKLRYGTAGEIGTRSRRLAPLGLVLKAASGISSRKVRESPSAPIAWPTSSMRRSTRKPLNGHEISTSPKHWENSSRAYEAGVWRGHAEIRLSPRGLALLELLGSRVVAEARQSLTPDREGWVRCTIPIETEAYGVRELMRLCEDVEVLGPPSLRDRFAETANAMGRRHGAPARKSDAR